MSGRISEKIMPLDEAVRSYIRPGCCIAIGGFTALRRPMAIAREIARQKIGDLFLTGNGMGLAEELLTGCGLVSRMETTLIGGVRPMPIAKAGPLNIERGEILVEDYSNWSYALRTIAGHYGLPFIPCMSIAGSDIVKYDSFGMAGLRKTDLNGFPVCDSIPPMKYANIVDPFNGYGLRPSLKDTTANKTNIYNEKNNKSHGAKRVVEVDLLPPLMADVAVVHAQSVSTDGVVRINGLLAEDAHQSFCAKRLIVSCERLCSPEELRQEPERNLIAPHMVDAVVVSPFGSYPGCVPGYYDTDRDFIMSYKNAVKRNDPDEIKSWWEEELAFESEWAYLISHIGWERLNSLRVKPKYRYK